MYTSRRNSRPQSHSSRNIIIAIILIVLVFAGIKFFGGNSNKNTKDQATSMTIVPNTGSTVYISPDGNKNTKISQSQPLYPSDAYVLIEQGGAKGTIAGSTIDMDTGTELKFVGSSSTGNVVKLNTGRAWIDSNSVGTLIELRNITVRVNPGNIAIVELNNIYYNTVYAIKGEVDIITSLGQYTLKAGEGFMISEADLNNNQTKLAELVKPIDSGLRENALFIRNNGASYLSSSSDRDNTGEVMNGSGTLGSGTLLSEGGKFVRITQPTDGSSVKTNTVTIMGDVLSTDVKRVTINDTDASVSPVNQTFVLQDYRLTDEINNLVYKVYNSNDVLLEKGVLVVYGPKNTNTTATLVPQNYPISSKDFVISSPSSNPYTTTESYVRVQGTVPANTVEYIVVNDFRLQKYVANSTTWYYHANADIGTMKDGMNLYTIKFYDASNRLLYTQLFTIIKDATPSA